MASISIDTLALPTDGRPPINKPPPAQTFHLPPTESCADPFQDPDSLDVADTPPSELSSPSVPSSPSTSSAGSIVSLPRQTAPPSPGVLLSDFDPDKINETSSDAVCDFGPTYTLNTLSLVDSHDELLADTFQEHLAILSSPLKPQELRGANPSSPQSLPSSQTAQSTVDAPTPQTPQPRAVSSHTPRKLRSFSSLLQLAKRRSFYKSPNSSEADHPGRTIMAEVAVAPGTGNRPASQDQQSTSTSRSTSPSKSTLHPKFLSPPNPQRKDRSGDYLRQKTGLIRSSTGLAITKIFRNHDRPPLARRRSNSMDLQRQRDATTDEVMLRDDERLPWVMAAEEGTGVKARRMSLSLPDDFTVDAVELYKEFAEPSMRVAMRGKTLGKGATSHVMLMCRKGFPNELYAVKQFRKKSTSEAEAEYEKKVKSEYSIAKSLHHPNIVETVRLCTHQGRWNHVMEWCADGDLFSLVQKDYLKREDRAADRMCLFKQLVQGVHYLHSNGIAHRDIKLENLLISDGRKLKITDFGVSEVFSGLHPGLRAAGGVCGKAMNADIRLCGPGICGSMPYIAPEVLARNGQYDPRPLDVWSSAIVMLHLIFGGAIWQRAESGQGDGQYEDLLKGWRKWNGQHPAGDSISEHDYPHVKAFDNMVNPPALRRLLLGMLHPDPAKRITVADVVRNRWLKQVECCQVDSFDDPVRHIDASKCNGGLASTTKIAAHHHLPDRSKSINHLIRLRPADHARAND